MTDKWVNVLSDEELSLLKNLISADFKISKLTIIEGESPFLLKKRLTKIRNKIKMNQAKKPEFKEYLEFLVDQNILTTPIAEILYEKHMKDKGGL